MGAGLVGSLLAAYLSKEGYEVNLYERRPDMRKAAISAGRSINLALSDRGWRALKMIGAEDRVREHAIPMKGRMMHEEDGSLKFQPYGREDQAIYSVSRGGLNQVLMNLAEEAGVEIHFDNGCEEVEVTENKATLQDGSNINPDLIFGADGAFSKVRLSMMKQDRFNYEQFYLEHGYKELSIPPAEDGGWRMEKNALHIWPRHSFMLIALPNADGSFTCTLFAPFEGKHGFDNIKTEADLEEYFNHYFPDAVPMMPTLKEDFFTNPTSSLVTVRCYPWVMNQTALIGDASHAIVPFYGQGMNSGFEDVTILAEMMKKHEEWDQILEYYQKSRKPSGDAIATLAINNFVEMRDRVADDQFLYRKKLEKKMHENYPDDYVPLYTLVTFSHTPYERALRMGELQDQFFEEQFQKLSLDGEVNDELAEKLVKEWKTFLEENG